MLLEIDFKYIANIFFNLAEKLPITLWVVLIAGVFGFFWAVIVTVIRIKKVKIIFPIILVYISFIKSTPVLLQLFVVYYGVPILFKSIGIDINDWSRTAFAIVTLVITYGAYLSDVMRPAYLAVNKGQHDAADSIGSTGTQKFIRIICPQLFPIALPSLCNLLLELIKETSILFAIGVVDLMGEAKLIIANNYGIGKMQVFIAVAIMYWIISVAVEKEINLLEKRYQKFRFANGNKV